jgi:hypothetical protein
MGIKRHNHVVNKANIKNDFSAMAMLEYNELLMPTALSVS